MDAGETSIVTETLVREYFFLQQTIEDFNKQVLEFKKWSVTTGIAALIAAYTKPVAQSGRIGVLIAALAAVPFWLTESFWKVFQGIHLSRAQEIENCITNGCTPPIALKIATTWQDFKVHENIGLILKSFFYPHVLLPHIFLLGLGLLLYVYKPPAAS